MRSAIEGLTSLIVVGASGAGRRVVDIALDVLDSGRAPFLRVAVVDDCPSNANLQRLQAYGVPLLGSTAQWLESSSPCYFSVGIGETSTRQSIANRLLAAGHVPVSLVAPTARISRTATVGPGSVVSPGTDVSANASIGAFAHVMANAAVSHDVEVGDYVNINPGAVVAGNVRIGAGATVGAGAVVLQGRSVGEYATIGAAACVTRDVPSRRTVKGIPAH